MQTFMQIRKLSTGLSKVSAGPLSDSFGRSHDYLRISLTEKCNLRCRYCMPADGIKLTPREKCLSLTELQRLSEIFVDRCGVTKIRLTGGEPTIDRKLVPLLGHFNILRQRGLKTVALTTNGLELRNRCNMYKSLGLDGVNLSLDTLREEKFYQITRRKGLQRVLDTMIEAVECGFHRVKLNCVIMRGVNDSELADFVELARQYPIEVRFIEFMPFFGNKWSTDLLFPYKEMLDHVLCKFPHLQRIQQGRNETTKLFKEPGAPGSIGFITSMTDNFCSGCNRLRLTSDGNLKVCLFGRSESSLRDLMRNGASDSEIVKTIGRALMGKSMQHAAPSQQDPAKERCPQDELANFSHLDGLGRAKMVDIGRKEITHRMAIARGEIFLGKHTLDQIVAKLTPKGDILTVSKIAGILAAKKTSSLIPMCHQVPLNHIKIDIRPIGAGQSLEVMAECTSDYKTGVEMESLVAVSVTLLTIYDMCKSVATNMTINKIELVSKTKCKSKIPTNAHESK